MEEIKINTEAENAAASAPEYNGPHRAGFVN